MYNVPPNLYWRDKYEPLNKHGKASSDPALIAHKISQKHSTQLITGTFKLAYASRKPGDGLIFHSDRGTQYTSHSFQNLLKTCNITQSFSPSGKPQHNAVMESFFSTLKREELYRTNYNSVQEFRNRVDWYINYYNKERPHATLGQKTPNAYEQIHYDRLDGRIFGHPGSKPEISRFTYGFLTFLKCLSNT